MTGATLVASFGDAQKADTENSSLMAVLDPSDDKPYVGKTQSRIRNKASLSSRRKKHWSGVFWW